MEERTPAQSLATARWVGLIGLICMTGILGGYAIGLHGQKLPVDRHGVPLGRDFMNTWLYGRAFFAADPGRFYDPETYAGWVQTLFPQNVVEHVWSYPPPFLMVAALFGLLPYLAALGLWTLCGLALLHLVTRDRRSPWLVVAVLTSPAVVYAILAGQVSLICGAVMLAAFDRLERRPVLAGLLFSLLLIKPQSAMLLPVLLIASRRWRVLASTAAGCLLIVAVSVAVNGWHTWIEYVTVGLPSQAADMRETIAVLAPTSITVTTAAAMSGLPSWAVTGLQVAATLLAVGLVAFVSSRHDAASRKIECLVFLACSIFASPYLLIHDLVAFSAALLIASFRDDLIESRAVLLMLLSVPALQIGLSPLHVNVAAFIPIGFALWLVTRGRDRCTPAGASCADLALSVQGAGA